MRAIIELVVAANLLFIVLIVVYLVHRSIGRAFQSREENSNG
jgi:hypothetical protein